MTADKVEFQVRSGEPDSNHELVLRLSTRITALNYSISVLFAELRSEGDALRDGARERGFAPPPEIERLLEAVERAHQVLIDHVELEAETPGEA